MVAGPRALLHPTVKNSSRSKDETVSSDKSSIEDARPAPKMSFDNGGLHSRSSSERKFRPKLGDKLRNGRTIHLATDAILVPGYPEQRIERRFRPFEHYSLVSCCLVGRE